MKRDMRFTKNLNELNKIFKYWGMCEMTQEELDEWRAKQLAREAAMTPEERAQKEEQDRLEEKHDMWRAQRSELTNGEIEKERDEYDRIVDFTQRERDDARNNQAAVDRRQDKLKKRIAELEAKLKQAETERDAARMAYLNLLNATSNKN